MNSQSHRLQFFISAPETCNYRPGFRARSLFADPLFPKDKALYSALTANGFRRSGAHLYRPCCGRCRACVPVRIPVAAFCMNRNQRRVWAKNRGLTITRRAAGFYEAHFRLYQKYLAARHADGGMDNPSREQYRDFLWTAWSDTLLFEFRLGQTLIAVAVVDQLQRALSAVYTFFDPDHARRSPGKFAILYLVEHARARGQDWLYLGYWIADCKKMSYKIEYQPLECFIQNEWQNIGRAPARALQGRGN